MNETMRPSERPGSFKGATEAPAGAQGASTTPSGEPIDGGTQRQAAYAPDVRPPGGGADDASQGFPAGAPYPGAAQQMMPPAYAAAERGAKRGWIVAIVAIIAVASVVAFGMASCSSAFSAPFSLFSSSDGDGIDALTTDAVAVVTMSGTIQYDGTECSPEGLKYLLDEAEANSRIKAVVLRVNSGGGTAAAGEEMAGYVADFGKPIVVSSASTNASAAYEISSQADYIFTAKSTMIGSIGTALEIVDYSGLMELLGISVETITSDDGKDSTYGYRSLTDEERAYYQSMVDQINDVFVATVAEGRGMTLEEVRELATGLTYTGIDAVDNGLADEIGTLEDAIAYAAELAGVESYTVIDLQIDDSGIDLLSLLASVSDQVSTASGAAKGDADVLEQ